jgi:hypothetical protein
MTAQNDMKTSYTPKLVYWRRWESQFQEPRTGTLKYALLNRKKTGFFRCVRVINKRLYLDVEETFKFFNSCKEKI